MTNELQEIQHTNLIRLLVFDHPKGTGILLDKYGKCQTFSDLQFPVLAENLNGENLTELLKKQDNLIYSGEKLSQNKALKDGVILTFKRPSDINHAKLVVKAKNSDWLDYVVSNFHELFGTEYSCWLEKQKTVSEKKMKKWVLNQDIPMSVFIEKKGKWKFVDYFNIVGPVADKKDVLSLDLSGIETDSVRIKLEYGYMFWEIDFAAIDFTENIPVIQKISSFESAINNSGKDVKELMVNSDGLYYVQPEIGDEVIMKFALPEPGDDARTLILHSQGYYTSKINPAGKEQLKDLLAFRKKGRMSEFSNELMIQQYDTRMNK